MSLRQFVTLLALAISGIAGVGAAQGETGDPTIERAKATLKRAASYFREHVAARGGYVFFVSEDLSKRYGEGEATRDQIWVQPPGTPAVGLAYLRAFRATGDRFYLEAATETAGALIYGQLKSGGWTAWIDFDPAGKRVADYRNGRGRGRNYSSLDDGQTQTATRFLARVDEALEFADEEIHQSVLSALDALLGAQFANGGFPQVWAGPVAEQPVAAARFPDYDWRTEGRIKNYWDLYTLNDDLAVTVAETLVAAREIYGDPRYEAALRKLGDFLILAQLPQPQPAWAQQYNYEMIPVWARKFEPPAVSGYESQGVILTLIEIFRITGDKKYLAPIPDALAYLRRSLLPDGRLARFYELESNRPLYMERRGEVYSLTYDDSELPDHYAFKVASALDQIEARYARAASGAPEDEKKEGLTNLARRARAAIEAMDEDGRWLSPSPRKQRHFGARVLNSVVFSEQVEALCEYLEASR